MSSGRFDNSEEVSELGTLSLSLSRPALYAALPSPGITGPIARPGVPSYIHQSPGLIQPIHPTGLPREGGVRHHHRPCTPALVNVRWPWLVSGNPPNGTWLPHMSPIAGARARAVQRVSQHAPGRVITLHHLAMLSCTAGWTGAWTVGGRVRGGVLSWGHLIARALSYSHSLPGVANRPPPAPCTFYFSW